MSLPLLCTLLGISFLSVYGHVALTYPPARKYDLDFLDNGRTPAPCGMPKGNVATSLLKGSTVNITWHLGYPHQGGFLLELLDPEEQHMMYLSSPEGSYTATDTTAQSFDLKLPANLECRNCTIRLLRQATEWGGNYRFWSCADVDIVPRSDFSRSCNGHGRYFANRCLCDKRFFGDDCQYEDECENNDDCGRFGQCVDLMATTYPKKQCFCSHGSFGHRCSKSSHIKSEANVDFSIYSQKNLSDSLTLYWRILKREGELEVVIVNKGTNYAAIGWRPSDATTECRQFPKIIGAPPPKIIKKSPPPPASKPQTTTKAEPEPEPESESETTSAPEPEPESEPEPKNKGKQHSKFNKIEPEPEPESEPESTEHQKKAPMSLADRLAASLATRNKRSTLRNEEEKQRFAAPLLKAASPVERKALTEPLAQIEPDAKSEAEPEAKSEAEPEAKSEAEPGAKSEAEPEAKSEAEPEAKSEAEPEAKSEAEPEAKSEAEPEAKSEAEPEAKSEAEPEAKSEAEHEAKSEAEPEAKAETEPKPEAEAEPEPDSKKSSSIATKGRSEPEPEPEAEGEPEPDSKPEASKIPVVSSPYAPRGTTLHPMDCTDIVVGMARGSFYRVKDYYTRDRSTPRVDEFWGGEDSLTAVYGWERDGETTILFRKNLTVNDPSDQPISESLMHVIWARGQEPDMYIHYPKSGLEVGMPSIPDFYRPDELKYHGRRDQRGVTTINFFESENDGKDSETNKIDWCGGQWKYPHSCSPAAKNCEYYARWEFAEATDEIDFVVSSSNTKLWTGIGFSDDTKMAKTDVVLGWFTPEGKYFIYDGYLPSYVPPKVDEKQSITNFSATQEDGITTLKFTRKRSTKDNMDLSFSDDKCLYLVFPVKGGNINYVNKRVSKHQLTPTISSQRICIRSCSKFSGADGDVVIFTTTPRPPELLYNVEFKITNPGQNMKVPVIGSPEYNTLVNQVIQSTQGVFEKLPGFVVSDVLNLEKNEPNILKAMVQIILNKAAYETKMGSIISDEDQVRADTEVKNIIQESMKTGRIGQLTVEPDFLRVAFLKADVLPVNDGSASVRRAGWETPLEFMNENKYWFLGAGIIALVVLALLQAIITTCRKPRNDAPPVSTKERLITNSRWKDYSRGATNYAYETYETDRENDTSSRHGPRREVAMEVPYKNGRPSGNGHVSSSHHPSDLNSGYGEVRATGGYGDTRSLQRPKNPSVLSDPRTTYSLPRGASGNSSPPSYNTAMQDLTPDFYYLPSQRKYSGEVVRVYVDYNKVK